MYPTSSRGLRGGEERDKVLEDGRSGRTSSRSIEKRRQARRRWKDLNTKTQEGKETL